MNTEDKLKELAEKLIVERNPEPITVPEVIIQAAISSPSTLFGIEATNYEMWKGNGSSGAISMEKILKAMEKMKSGKL